MSGSPGLSRRALLGLFRQPREPEVPAAVAPLRAPTAADAAGPVGAVASPRSAAPSRMSSATRGPMTVAASGSMAVAATGPMSRTSLAPAQACVASTVAAPPAFSLESFYASRARAGEATVDGRLPVFSLREGLVVPQGPPEKAVAPGGQDARLAPAAGASTSEVSRDEGAPRAPSPPDTTGAPARQGGASGVMPALGATVRVRTPFCLAWQGSFCTTCVERCPVEGAILVEAGRPRVVAERCDGCGTCVRVCPAPINAFELRPAGAPGVTS